MGVTSWEVLRAGTTVELVGELRDVEARKLWRTLHRVVRAPGPHLDLDLARTTAVDAVIVVLLLELCGDLDARGTRCALVHVPAAIEPLVQLYAGGAHRPPPPPSRKPGAIRLLGAATAALGTAIRAPLTFAGELVTSFGQVALRPRLANWRSIPMLVQRAGAEAIPIVSVLLFLVGLTIAVQSTPPLRLLGANIYVVDLVGISVTRELAPLMTAIIITGRSAAGFAAEIGTMRISEEIDALRTMGIAPMPYLVVPRVITLAIVAPMLTLIGESVAILGGLAVGVYSLDLTPQAYFSELRAILVLPDIWTGLVKSFVFGIAIATIGCQQGLAARGAAAGVGRRTTATVVASLLAIVVLDALLTMLFRRLGV